MPSYKPRKRPDQIRRCEATAKSTGERCIRRAVIGWNVCPMHGAGGGRPPKTLRYVKSLAKNPILAQYFAEMLESGVNEFDLDAEVLLARARLAYALDQGADEDVITDLQQAVIKAVQKNMELAIRREGLIKKSDAEDQLRAAITVVAKYVPDALKPACFDELTRCLAGGGPRGASLLSADSVVPAGLGEGEPEFSGETV